MIKIAQVKSIVDTEGKFGPQKKINIRESLENGDRWLSGWVPLSKFNPEDWVAGKTIDAEVYQTTGSDGKKYWNFKILSQKAKAEKANNEEVLNAIREVYKKLLELERKIDRINPSSDANEESPFP